jgi:hypothetical protein
MFASRVAVGALPSAGRFGRLACKYAAFFMASLPSVTGVSPNSGPTTGGTTVVITGTVLVSEVGVNFGSTPAASFTINSGTMVTAVSPSGVAGSVDITLTNGFTNVQTSPADQFTYIQTTTSTPTLREWSMLVLTLLLAGAGYMGLMKAAGGQTI